MGPEAKKSGQPAGSRRTSGEGWALLGTCPVCGGKEGACRCREPRPPQGKPAFRLRLERRRGKPVTVIQATGLERSALAALLREAKALCGAGGTAKAQELELQGDHRERLRALLADRGYRVKG